MELTKQTLQEFIANYSAPFHPLTDDYWQQAYNQGSAEVLQALKATFLDNPNGDFTLDSYLESDKLIDQCIQQAKDNLAKIGIKNKGANLGKEAHSLLEDYLNSNHIKPATVSLPYTPDYAPF